MLSLQRILIASVLSAVAVGTWLGGTCHAQTTEEVYAAVERLSELVEQGDWSAAETQSQRTLLLAERAMADQPQLLAEFCAVVGEVFVRSDREDLAVPMFARAVQLEKRVGARSEKLIERLSRLGDCQYEQSEYEGATQSYWEALQLSKRVLGETDLTTAECWRDVAWCYYDLEDFARAEEFFREVVSIRRQRLGRDTERTANSLRELGNAIYYQQRYADALPLYEESLAAYENVYGKESEKAAKLQYDRADCLHEMGRDKEAAEAYRRSIEVHQAVYGDNSTEAGPSERGLASLLRDEGRYAEAEALYKHALVNEEREFGGSHVRVARGLEGLANIRSDLGNYAEAGVLYLRVLKIREENEDELGVAITCLNLANNYIDQDLYADAEQKARRALAIRMRELGPDDPLIAGAFNTLGVILRVQGRNDEAVPFYRRALAIREATLDPDDPELATSLINVANIEVELKNYEAAEAMYRRSLEISRKSYGEGHVELAACTSRLGDLRWNQGRYDEAREFYDEALRLLERHWGPVHPKLASVLYDLSWCHYEQQQYEPCVELLDRAINIDRQTPIGPYTSYLLYNQRARALRDMGRTSDAVRDLERAMRLAEESRGGSSGAELERAQFFATFGSAFERMVAWQMEDGVVEKAIDAMERARARSLLDEIGLLGVDIGAGRSLAEEEQLRASTQEVRAQLAELEGEFERLMQQREQRAANEERMAELQARIGEARQELYAQYRDARATSRIYQQMSGGRDRIPPLGDIQRQLLAEKSLMLAYMLGENAGYVVAITRDDAMLYELGVGEVEAEILGIEAGAFAEEQAQSVLLSDDGVMRALSRPAGSEQLEAKLAALWLVLVPHEYHEALTNGEIEHLHVIPHGSLSFLPLETLVVDREEETHYLVDKGPPIDYAPSVSVLHSLRIRAGAQTGAASALTVGNPQYATVAGGEDQDEDTRFVVLRSNLTPLPYTGHEARRVGEVLSQAGLDTRLLLEGDATEANVRRETRGRRIVHLACHGFADQAHGNLFGALALSTGSGAEVDATDDGFLTLGEIYDLDLRGCELAILSACQTNYGPEQEGEGVWTLSRGFLVAGSRRVVASNWVVDDAATANLVSYFCDGLAERLAEDRDDAYAESLLAAKRWVRSQEKWSAPYFWASMVLVGPR